MPKFCCLSDGFMLVTDAENTFASAAVGDVKICIVFKCVNNELNQIGIKIDMYRQEYRFTPAFAFIQAV